jgi:hypothetical protein
MSESMLSKKSFGVAERNFPEPPVRFVRKNHHLRDFWRRSIFDFFDSIGQSEKNSSRANVFRVTPDSGHRWTQRALRICAKIGNRPGELLMRAARMLGFRRS